jgi:hypothetical protein
MIVHNLANKNPRSALNYMQQRPSSLFNFPRNITNYSDRIVPLIHDFTDNSFVTDFDVTWCDNFRVSAAEIITDNMFGYSINLVGFDDMFNDGR